MVAAACTRLTVSKVSDGSGQAGAVWVDASAADQASLLLRPQTSLPWCCPNAIQLISVVAVYLRGPHALAAALAMICSALLHCSPEARKRRKKRALAHGAPAARNPSRALSDTSFYLTCVTCCRGSNAGLQCCALWLQRPRQRTALWQGPAHQAALREAWSAAAHETLRYVAQRGCNSWQTARAAPCKASTRARAGAGRVRSASHL